MRFVFGSAVALICTTVACGGGGGSSGKKICNSGEQKDCGALDPAQVGGEVYVAGLKNATCASDGKSWDVTQCTPKGGAEFVACTGTGQGDCRSKLACVEVGTFQNYCLATCTDDASCGAGKACVDWNGDQTVLYCLPKVTTGNECYADNTCSSTGDTCMGTAYDSGDYIYGSCSRACDATNIGKQAGCNPGEYCVGNNVYIEKQQGAPSCTLTAPNPCNAAQGYRCIDLTGGPACAREPGNCVGGILPLIATVAALSAVQDASLCTIPAEPTGQTNNYIGEIFFDNKACGITGVTGLPAEVSCERLGAQVGFCVGFCGLENGSELSCGTGYTCSQPTLDAALYIDYQTNGSNRVTCTGATDTTTCASGYSCYNTGTTAAPTYNCVQASKVCT